MSSTKSKTQRNNWLRHDRVPVMDAYASVIVDEDNFTEFCQYESWDWRGDQFAEYLQFCATSFAQLSRSHRVFLSSMDVDSLEEFCEETGRHPDSSETRMQFPFWASASNPEPWVGSFEQWLDRECVMELLNEDESIVAAAFAVFPEFFDVALDNVMSAPKGEGLLTITVSLPGDDAKDDIVGTQSAQFRVEDNHLGLNSTDVETANLAFVAAVIHGGSALFETPDGATRWTLGDMRWALDDSPIPPSVTLEAILAGHPVPAHHLISMQLHGKPMSSAVDIDADGVADWELDGVRQSANMLIRSGSNGSVILRTFSQTETFTHRHKKRVMQLPTKTVCGWFVHDGAAHPQTEAEMFDAHCTDFQTGEPIPPEEGVTYVAAWPIG